MRLHAAVLHSLVVHVDLQVSKRMHPFLLTGVYDLYAPAYHGFDLHAESNESKQGQHGLLFKNGWEPVSILSANLRAPDSRFEQTCTC